MTIQVGDRLPDVQLSLATPEGPVPVKSGDFFAVKDHPNAKFETSKIVKGDKGFTVTGSLTMLGKTKEVTFPAEITTGDTFSMKASFKINRADFGMTYGEGKIDNEVAIDVNISAKKS